ncbi:TPA: RNA helicase, partial [Vibrio cholerae]|nr:RNA helicase [Vibrio cholerae]HEJ2463782.1 RNA helicase [Vibrio cholerae]
APELFAIERLTQALLPRVNLAGFEPTNQLPESKLDTRPLKPKKPKKPKKVEGAGENKGSAAENKPKAGHRGQPTGQARTAKKGGTHSAPKKPANRPRRSSSKPVTKSSSAKPI